MLLLATVVALGACAGSSGAESTGSTMTNPSDTTRPDTAAAASPPTSDSTAPVDTVTTAIADLATRLGVDSRRIRLIDSRSVSWPDASMGCPGPNDEQIQGEVAGYLVLIAYEDRLFNYHAGSDGSPFLCPSEEKDGGREFIPPPGFDT
jgi:hypothetical protein